MRDVLTYRVFLDMKRGWRLSMPNLEQCGLLNVEYESLGIPWKNRGARIDEQIPLLRRLWSEEVIDFTGTYHRIDRAGICPRPSRRIPIWCGGFSEPAVQRAARVADGFLFASASSESIELATRLKQLLADSGRKDVANFGLQSIVAHSLGPKVWRQEYEGWKKLGASHFTLRTHRSTPPKPNSAKPAETIGEHIQVLETFIRELR